MHFLMFFVFGCFSGGEFGILGGPESPQEIAGNTPTVSV